MTKARTSPVFVAAAVLLVALFFAPASASANNYGAIAFSTSTGAHGYSYDYASRGAAESRALGECRSRGGGCRIAIWFRNACGALAVGAGNGWGAAWGNSRAAAERSALGYCRKYTSGCSIRRWVCTSR